MTDLEQKARRHMYELIGMMNDLGAGELVSMTNGHAEIGYGITPALSAETDWDAEPKYGVGFRCKKCRAPVYRSSEGGFAGLAMDMPCSWETRRLVRRYEKRIGW